MKQQKYSSGFTLLEVTIAMGIGMAALYGMMSMTSNTQVSVNRIQGRVEFGVLASNLNSTLSDKTACAKVFSQFVIGTSGSSPITSIYSEGGTTGALIAKTGNLSSYLTITKLSFDSITQLVPTVYSTTLNLEGKSLVGTLATGKTLSQAYNLVITRDATTGKITACKDATSSSDLWTKHTNNVDIYYNTASGKVGIANNAPTATLQVGSLASGNFSGVTTLGIAQSNADSVGLSIRNFSVNNPKQQFCNTAGCAYLEQNAAGGGLKMTGPGAANGILEVTQTNPGNVMRVSDTTSGRYLVFNTNQGANGASVGIFNGGQYWDFGVNTSGDAFIGRGGTGASISFSRYNGSVNVGGGASAGSYPFQVTGSGNENVYVRSYINAQYGANWHNNWSNISWSAYFGAAIYAVDGFYNASDERMKKNIINISSQKAIEFIEKSNPVIYEWKDLKKKGTEYGFIAQQLIKSGFSEFTGLAPAKEVQEKKDKDGFISPKNTQFTVDYARITSILTRAVQYIYQKHLNQEEKIFKLQEENKLMKTYLCKRDQNAPFCNFAR